MAVNPPSSPFSMVPALHSFSLLSKSTVPVRTSSDSPQRQRLLKAEDLHAGTVDTTSKSISSFLRHKMRKLTKFEPDYVRKLMNFNMIKTQMLPQVGAMTEIGGETERTTVIRPRTCVASARITRTIYHSSSPKPITFLSKRHSSHQHRAPNPNFEVQLANYELTKGSISTSLQSISQQRSMEKTKMRDFFGTVKLITDIECRKMKHIPAIFYSKVESHASYLQDAVNISTEYRKGISDPSRFVGRIERKRWGRLKARPQFTLPKD